MSTGDVLRLRNREVVTGGRRVDTTVGGGRSGQEGGEFATVPFHGFLFPDASFELKGLFLLRDGSDWRLPLSEEASSNCDAVLQYHSIGGLEWR